MATDVPLTLRRVAAGLFVVLVVPMLATVATLNEDAPLAVGQEAARTVVSDRSIRIEDVEATQDARDRARLGVEPVERTDLAAQEETYAELNELFAELRLARAPIEPEPAVSSSDGTATGPGPPAEATPSPSPPSIEEQVESLQDDIGFLEEDAQQQLVELTDEELERVQQDIVDVVRELYDVRIVEDQVQDILDTRLPTELLGRGWPEQGFAQDVAAPIVREVLRPNVVVDAEESRQRQDEAEQEVETQFATWADGDIVVEQGDVVTPVQFQALEQLGEAGSEPGVAFVRALIAMVLVVTLFALYLRTAQSWVWSDPGRLFVLAATYVVAAVLLFGIELLVGAFGSPWWFTFPIGGLVLLIAVLTNSQVGLASVLPLATLALLFAPSLPALAILVAAVVVMAAPMVDSISTRVGLRRASVRVALVAPLLAVVVAVVFGPRDQLLTVAVAAAIAGAANVGLLQGLLPAFENVFRLATVTALLDLADRNHPLLRELEAKAMGSYNHSVMVANLAERCCREIGANHLLGQVAGLYHDIGKVRQPVFFIENQRGIANPHDQLTPRMSAVIIQNHVVDGVEMAIEHRLPPDVVDCIGSHHGTMRVSYFYRRAIEAAGGDESKVDEAHFRYKGHKPRSKEAAVLLLADCTEAATRAMALDRGTLATDVIEDTVDKLVRERLEDGQFEDCQLTFVEFEAVRDTLVEALTGIYHPRIGYPAGTNPTPVHA